MSEADEAVDAPPSLIVTVGDADFTAQVLKAPLPAVVMFTADWCGPCRLLRPRLEALARRYANVLRVFSLNIEDSTDIPTRYGVRGVPTMILFSQGEFVSMKVGALSDDYIIQWLNDSGVA